MNMVEAARRHQEGFWVDVDRGAYQAVQTNKYGTFYPTRGKKVLTPSPFATPVTAQLSLSEIHSECARTVAVTLGLEA